MKVANILQNKKHHNGILQVSHDASISSAIDVMVTNDTGSVAVFEQGKFIGMLTFRELFTAIHEKGFTVAATVLCGDIIEKNGSWTTPDDSVDQVRNIMTSKHIRYLPVIEDNKLTDVISFYDVARSVAKAVSFENRMLKEYIGNWPAADDATE